MNAVTLVETSEAVPLIIKDVRTLDQKIEDAKNRIKSVFSEGKTLVTATSFGKDSSVLSNIILHAAIEYKAEHGSCPHVRFVNSNTGIENPVMDLFSRSEAKKIISFARNYGVDSDDSNSDSVSDSGMDVGMDIIQPNLSNNYLVNMVGGRMIASMPGADSTCSVMMKVIPITTHKNRIFKKLGKHNVVTAVGKRTDESTERGRGMLESGEATGQVIERDGELMFSPIADFTLTDIAVYLGRCGSEDESRKIESYSDFKALLDVYRSGNGGECMINIYATGRASTTSCGARFGCYLCVKTENDSSMENVLKEPENEYMRPLNELRSFIADTHFDPARRNWLARTVDKNGMIKLAPSAYSPQHCEALLKSILTIDANERELAAELGIAPRFELLSFEEVLAVEILWARYGTHKPAQALSLWNEVNNKGASFSIPEVPKAFVRSDLKKKLSSKSVPFADAHFYSSISGFRNVEAIQADCENLVIKNGKAYTDANVGNEFCIDSEGAELFEYFNLGRFLEKFVGSDSSPAQVIHYFSGLGTVTFSKGFHSQMDKTLRIANQLHRIGLVDDLNDPEAIIAKINQYHSPQEPQESDMGTLIGETTEGSLLSLLARDAACAGHSSLMLQSF